MRAAGGAQMRISRLRHEKWSARVGGKDPVPLLGVMSSSAACSKRPALLTRRSSRPNSSMTAATDLADALGVGEVGAEGEGVDVERRERADSLFGFGLRVAIGDGDVGAAGRQPQRDGAADALGSAGDQRGAARERGGCDSWFGCSRGSGIAGLYGFGVVAEGVDAGWAWAMCRAQRKRARRGLTAWTASSSEWAGPGPARRA